MPRTTRFLALASVLASLTAAVALAPPAGANGIFTTPTGDAPVARSPVRLKSHRVTAKIRDGVADVTVEQTFHSDASAQLEGTYLFPLPRGAAVAKFAMTMGGRMGRQPQRKGRRVMRSAPWTNSQTGMPRSHHDRPENRRADCRRSPARPAGGRSGSSARRSPSPRPRPWNGRTARPVRGSCSARTTGSAMPDERIPGTRNGPSIADPAHSPAPTTGPCASRRCRWSRAKSE